MVSGLFSEIKSMCLNMLRTKTRQTARRNPKRRRANKETMKTMRIAMEVSLSLHRQEMIRTKSTHFLPAKIVLTLILKTLLQITLKMVKTAKKAVFRVSVVEAKLKRPPINLVVNRTKISPLTRLLAPKNSKKVTRKLLLRVVNLNPNQTVGSTSLRSSSSF